MVDKTSYICLSRNKLCLCVQIKNEACEKNYNIIWETSQLLETRLALDLFLPTLIYTNILVIGDAIEVHRL